MGMSACFLLCAELKEFELDLGFLLASILTDYTLHYNQLIKGFNASLTFQVVSFNRTQIVGRASSLKILCKLLF